MAQATTCACAACSAISSLDLKFVAHAGAFASQQISGHEDIAGSDVIVAHRLLKNSVAERTGCHAYALFTEACLARLPPSLTLPRCTESLDEIGDVACAVYDLRPVLQGARRSTRQHIGAAEADFQYAGQAPARPFVLWSYFLEPAKRVQWQTGLTAARNESNENGRLGPGSVSHCDHGSWQAEHRFVDWRPFSYFTAVATPVKSSLMAMPACTETTEFIPIDDRSTEIHYRFRLDDRSWPNRFQMSLFAPLVRRMLRQQTDRLVALLERDATRPGAASKRAGPGSG
jgi:hypothetical protein